MARRPKAARQKLDSKTLKGVQSRLRKWQREHYDSQAQFAESVGLSASTLKAWLAKRPRAPDLAALLQLAKSEGLSIDWILTGEGPELRCASRPLADLAGDLHAILAQACATGYLEGYAGEIRQFLPPIGELLGELTKSARERIDGLITDRAKLLHLGAAEYYKYLIIKFGDGAIAALASMPEQLRLLDGPPQPGDPAFLKGLFPDGAAVDDVHRAVIREAANEVLELRRGGKDAAMAAAKLSVALSEIS